MTTTLNAIPLPNDLQWLDEFAPKVVQQLKTTLDTAAHITAISRSTGMPVTLKSWDEGAFVTRSTVLLLQAAADQPGLSMPLVLRGTAFQVMFRHHDGPALLAEPVKDIANPGPDDLYRITLNLIQGGWPVRVRLARIIRLITRPQELPALLSSRRHGAVPTRQGIRSRLIRRKQVCRC